jgi:hypothetical protein
MAERMTLRSPYKAGILQFAGKFDEIDSREREREKKTDTY